MQTFQFPYNTPAGYYEYASSTKAVIKRVANTYIGFAHVIEKNNPCCSIHVDYNVTATGQVNLIQFYRLGAQKTSLYKGEQLILSRSDTASTARGVITVELQKNRPGDMYIALVMPSSKCQIADYMELNTFNVATDSEMVVSVVTDEFAGHYVNSDYLSSTYVTQASLNATYVNSDYLQSQLALKLDLTGGALTSDLTFNTDVTIVKKNIREVDEYENSGNRKFFRVHRGLGFKTLDAVQSNVNIIKTNISASRSFKVNVKGYGIEDKHNFDVDLYGRKGTSDITRTWSNWHVNDGQWKAYAAVSSDQLLDLIIASTVHGGSDLYFAASSDAHLSEGKIIVGEYTQVSNGTNVTTDFMDWTVNGILATDWNNGTYNSDYNVFRFMAPANTLVMDSKFAVGTRSPEYPVDVRGTMRLADASTSDAFSLRMGAGSDVARLTGDGTNMVIMNEHAGSVTIGSNNTDHAVFNSSGNMHVCKNGGEATIGKTSNSPAGILNVAGTHGSYVLYAEAGNYNRLSSTGTDFSTVKTMQIKSNGLHILNASSHTTAPSLAYNSDRGAPYEIRAADTEDSDWGFLRLRAGGGTTTTVSSHIDLIGYTASSNGSSIAFNTAAEERMRIKNNGYIGIGVSDPASPLEVHGATHIKANGANLKISGSDHVYLRLMVNGTDYAYLGYGSSNATDLYLENQKGTRTIIKNATSAGPELQIGSDLRWYNSDGGISQISAVGGAEGTGVIYVGQNTSTGGGMMFNGDDSPDVVGAQDHLSFFTSQGGTRAQYMSVAYNSVSPTFYGSVTVSSDLTVNGGLAAGTTVNGNATVATDLTVSRDVTVSRSLTVSGTATCATDLYLSGTSKPTIRPTGQNDLEVRSSSTGVLELNGSNSGKVLIGHGGGSVGIGATDPVSKLHVYGTATVGVTSNSPVGQFHLIGSNGGMVMFQDANWGRIKSTGTDYSTSRPLYLHSSGVLVGDTSTNYSTNPSLATDAAAPYEIRGGKSPWDDWGLLRLRAGGGTNTVGASHIDLLGWTGGDNRASISFNTAGEERMRITHNGYIGIGVSDPSSPLEVHGATHVQANGEALKISGSDHAYLRFAVNGTNYGYIGYDSIGSTDLYINNGNGTRTVIRNAVSAGPELQIGSDLRWITTDGGIAQVSAVGVEQGTGIFYAGQNVSYGGGMIYNGDDTPDTIGTVDHLSFFTRNNNSDAMFMSVPYSSINTTFYGNVTVSSDFSVNRNATIGGTLGVTGVTTVNANAESLVLNGVDHTYLRFKVNGTSYGYIGYGGTDSSDLYIENQYGTRTIIKNSGSAGPELQLGSDLRWYTSDGGVSQISAVGGDQGTGVVYVGQNMNTGGGMMFNGDDTPDMIGTQDHLSFFTSSGGTRTEFMSVADNSVSPTFYGSVTVSTDLTVNSNMNVTGSVTFGDTANATVGDMHVVGSASGLVVFGDNSGYTRVKATTTDYTSDHVLFLHTAGVRIGSPGYSTSSFPDVTTDTSVAPYEIRGGGSLGDDWGFLRLRAGGGTNYYATCIDLMGYTTNSNSFSMRFKTASLDRMTINSSGYVGIGTTTPTFPLHVATSVNSDFGGGTFVWTGSAASEGTQATDYYSIVADAGIACQYLSAYSDRRIKEDVQDLVLSDWVNKFDAITLKSYEYIDKVYRGASDTIGFIAQDLYTVDPMLVNNHTIGTVPNVFAQYGATIDVENNKLTVLVSDIADLADKISTDLHYQLYDINHKKYMMAISEIDGQNVTMTPVDNDSNMEKMVLSSDEEVFFYGTLVSDFHTVNWNKLNTLHMAKTKDMSRVITEQEARIATLEATVAAMEARLAALESA